MLAPDEAGGKVQPSVRATPACADVERARGVVWFEPSADVEVQYNEMTLGRLRDAVLRAVCRG
jgi:hypothetical protein